MRNNQGKKKTDPAWSPVGWYIGSVVLQFDEKIKRKTNTVWENTHLIKAKNISDAYQKLRHIGKKNEYEYTRTDGAKVAWRYIGVRNILPVYEPLEDGAEVMWTDHGLLDARATRKLVHTKMYLLKRLKAKSK